MKIAIVGTHPDSRRDAPYKDAAWQIWGCSPGNMNKLPRHDVWFELHRPYLFQVRPEYGAWCLAQPRIYMIEARADAPGSVTYPKEEMVAEFGPYFFTSSISWMFALAITLKPEAIGIYGVNCGQPDEYAHQRPAHQHFTQIARDRGIEVVCSRWSQILKPSPMYGFDTYPTGVAQDG